MCLLLASRNKAQKTCGFAAPQCGKARAHRLLKNDRLRLRRQWFWTMNASQYPV
jgi:hypothetical protein